MGTLADLRRYARFTWGLREFLKHRLTLEEARDIVRQRMEERETNFLRLVRKGVFGYSKSPYLPLLSMAGCGMGDLESMVKQRGLEKTLLTLREAGVYVTFEEFKGRKPISRNGKIIPAHPHPFDNPFLSRYYHSETSGSTGAGTRVAVDLNHQLAQTPFVMLSYQTHGLLGTPTLIWYGILPDSAGINTLLRSAPFGNFPLKWFTPITRKNVILSLKNRLGTYYIVLLGRFYGAPFPWPEPLGLEEAGKIVHWIQQVLSIHGQCLVRCHVSPALRICQEALNEGIHLKGCTFISGGEPPTAVKVREIKRTGARFIPTYNFVETGIIGLGCSQATDINDSHLFEDALALVQFPRTVPGSDRSANAFCFTSLLPSAPKIMLNVESDDYGLVENRSCGCPMEHYGYTTHLRDISSFQKLTAEGVTLVGSEMIQILEETLPSRFGGGPFDFQLLEEEENGKTRLSLLVNPRIGPVDEKEIIETVSNHLLKKEGAGNLAQAIWTQAGTLRIVRKDPLWNPRGKWSPLIKGKNTGPT